MKSALAWCAVPVLVVCAVPAFADESRVVRRGAEVVGDVVFPMRIDVDLRDLPVAAIDWKPGDPIREVPKRRPNPEPGHVVEPPTGVDPLLALQHAAPAGSLNVTEVLNIAGQGFTGVNPPDTVGDAGPDYYIQSINASAGTPFVIHDKTDGSVVAGPIFMQTFGTGACADGLGDPIVLYDEAADRWLLSEFSGTGNHLCVYVSQTADPVAGGWCAYDFATPGFPDYPKYGVWSDAYYVTTNESSPAVYALDRTQMLACAAARPAQRFTAPDLSGFPFQALTPADVDGAGAPPAGAPGLIVRHRDTEVHGPDGAPAHDLLEIWEFDVDWDTPANSTFALDLSVQVAEFDSDLCGLVSFSCFPQQGSGTTLDPLREVVMNRLSWRDFGGYAALIGNYVTDVDGTNHGGKRWFELRDSGSGWTLHQEGTYAPDIHHRWMGGIAMDGDGNILLGYNTSSSTMHPSLRYTGREAGDPLGTMSSEVTLVSGSSPNGSNRYGDYSAMSIDPEDDCTFWFTGEYNVATQWSTRIGAIKFEVCGDPGFTLNASPSARSICAGETAQYDLTLGSVQLFNEPVTLSSLGHPAGSTATFVPNPVPALPGTSAMTIGNTGAVGFGTSVITVSGLASPSGLSRSRDVSLTVYPASPNAPVLESPADDAIDQPRAPNLQWDLQAQADDYLVEVATDAGFANVVRSVTVPTDNWTVAPALDIDTEYFWRVTAGNPCGESGASAVFSFVTALPTILLVDDDDDGPDVLGTYQTLLDALAVYDVWDVVDEGGEPTAADLAPYRAVIWFSGDRFTGNTAPTAGPQTAAENALRAYLDNGGCFLISSQDYLWDMGGSGHNVATPFMSSHLGLASGTSDSGDYTRVDGENLYAGMSDMTLTYPFSDFSDILVLGTGGQAAFRGDLGSTNLGAISKVTPVYLTTYLSFPVEALSSANQVAVMSRFQDSCDAQAVLFADNFEDGTFCDWSGEEPMSCP